MSGDIAWNSYIDTFGKEPASSQQLQNYAKGETSIESLNFKTARDTFSRNKGKGRVQPSANTKSPKSPKSPRSPFKIFSKKKTNQQHLEEYLSDHANDEQNLEMSTKAPPPKMIKARTASFDEDGPAATTNESVSVGNMPYVNYSTQSMKDEKSSRWAWGALIFNIFALVVSIINSGSLSGGVNSRLDKSEAIMTKTDLIYDGMEGRDESMKFYVGNYYGWEYASGRGIDYSKGSTQGGNDVQYPFPDLHVNYGDVLIFKQHDDWLRDDLFLVPEEVYETCNFSHPYKLTNDNGEMDNSSALWLAYPEDMHCETGTAEEGSLCQYEFTIEDWSDGNFTDLGPDLDEDDLFVQLITADTLYFVSTYNWHKSSSSNACAGGLKLKVHIEGWRKLMPLKRSSDIWRGIGASETVETIHASIGHISRQMVLRQFNDEQRIRSEGGSGLTNVRQQYDGDAAYDDGTYTNGAVAAMHDHPDNLYVIGLGEIQAVINGVEFQTRHNDYNLNMPSTTSMEYHATEAIPFPDVPPEVLNAGSVDNQIAEMQEWFRAFKNQDITHRDYPQYFKPILCYIEGTWILEDDDVEEPFESDRHKMGASTWKQLQDKVRWMVNSGRKDSAENLARLPGGIRNLVNDTYPIPANWEYRIACSPLKNDIPTERFRVADDLSVQLMGSPQTREELYFSRRARFELNRYIDLEDPDGDHQWSPGRKKWNYLDYLMEQIPGKDNYGCNITDELPDGTERGIHYITDRTLNACYYTRFYGLTGADAMGSTGHRRGWCDRHLFASRTTQSKVSPIEFNYETADDEGFIEYHRTVSRWTYAIPLEIIYLTPLTKWNPHGIGQIDQSSYDYSRSGDCSSTSTAFSGWTRDNAYFTPASFYEDLTASSSADTHTDNVCVAKDGNVYPVYPSGHWISTPVIGGGVGRVRQRYPMFPIHATGSGSYKEAKALQSVILPSDYDDAVNGVDFFGDDREIIYGFEVNLQGGGHQHVVYIPGWKIVKYWQNSDTLEWLSTSANTIEVESDTRDGHTHTVKIWRSRTSTDAEWNYHIESCRYGKLSDADQYDDGDWTSAKCPDHHDQIERE